MTITGVEAVIFDMDGTLIDSELLTDKAVRQHLADQGIEPGDLDCTQFYGVTWVKIANMLAELFPSLDDSGLAATLQHHFHTMGLTSPPPPILGSSDAVRAAFRLAKTAIGTSSNRESLEEVIDYLDIRGDLSTTASAEDYENSKPHPDCYLTVANRLGVNPKCCLVFEDSIPGLQAARAAGMFAIAITHRTTDLALATEIADLAIANYSELEPDFFSIICR
jgi:beta-phosphoglucomutase-like phosphatase (HAD superfamily)